MPLSVTTSATFCGGAPLAQLSAAGDPEIGNCLTSFCVAVLQTRSAESVSSSTVEPPIDSARAIAPVDCGSTVTAPDEKSMRLMPRKVKTAAVEPSRTTGDVA